MKCCQDVNNSKKISPLLWANQSEVKTPFSNKNSLLSFIPCSHFMLIPAKEEPKWEISSLLPKLLASTKNMNSSTDLSTKLMKPMKATLLTLRDSSLNSPKKLETHFLKKVEKLISTCWTDMEKENSTWLIWDTSTNNFITVLKRKIWLSFYTQLQVLKLTRFPCTSFADTWQAESQRRELKWPNDLINFDKILINEF